MTCKVGILPHHLVVRADAYDGLYGCIVSIYSDRCTNVLKREFFWQNKGCCIACVLGNCPLLSIQFFRNDISGIDCLINSSIV
jgi:hypothetical protein